MVMAPNMTETMTSTGLEPRRLPRQERSRQRVDDILDAAAELLIDRGFDAVTTNLIADRADIPVGYACLVGRVSGLYAQASPIELRIVSEDTCKSCSTKECITGTDTTTPCPTFEKPFLLKQNTYCTLCTECIRSCDKDNLSLFTRPVGVDLENVKMTQIMNMYQNIIYKLYANTILHTLLIYIENT